MDRIFLDANILFSAAVGVHGYEHFVQRARSIYCMSPHPSIPEALWSTVPPEAQAALLAFIASLERRIAELEHRLNLNSTNSSRPPSSDPPAVKVKRRPPPLPSGRKRGGQPGHKR